MDSDICQQSGWWPKEYQDLETLYDPMGFVYTGDYLHNNSWSHILTLGNIELSSLRR